MMSANTSKQTIRSGRRFVDRIPGFLVAILGVATLLAVASVPLHPLQQAMLSGATALAFLVCNRFKGRAMTMFLVMLSLAVSLRYISWRVTDTLTFNSKTELCLGILLAAAEVYAILVLVLGYVQTVWPLDRKPLPMPADPLAWPVVDVFIPTYNEPLAVVRATVLGCMAMDYPAGKLRVHLLDDGNRAEFRIFAGQCGVSYLTRADNAHAKAGNLNAALARTTGEYIAVFDCDHVPTRSFLQMTLGWLVHDPRVALVQTPHHFYSPDPFQRNLAAGTRVPAEGNMFYGLVQDGNDYWNACFFCGSCAVLRRTALEEIGGFAVETVTEDAHTMLKLHRAGWSSAYLRIPMAAGLATERLSQHIGQRIRWARGMIQILRTDNPLFGRGLTLGQRICYFQAMAHFLFAIPRIVFLAAPLAYLLFYQNVIAASPLAIIAYAMPHIFHSVATNSRIQKNWRHSFWSEIYETVLALALVRVSVMTLFMPRRGKFGVTAKGGLLENGYFDLRAVYPNLIMAALLIAGIARGVFSLCVFDNPPLVFQALLLNSIWAFFSLLTVMAALAVGRETRQVRSRARVVASLPVSVFFADGRVVSGNTRDLSLGGAGIVAPRPPGAVEGAPVRMGIRLGAEGVLIPSRIVRWDDDVLQASFMPQTISEETNIVKAVFGRPDAWSDWSNYRNDQPVASLLRVLVSIKGLFRPRDKGFGFEDPGAKPMSRAKTVAALAFALSCAATVQAYAQRPPSPATAVLASPPLSGADSSIPQSTRVLTLTLKELGAHGQIAMRGTSRLQGVQFGIRDDEIVVGARLDLVGASSPYLDPSISHDTVTLNDQYVGTIPVVAGQPDFSLQMPVNPVFFQEDNTLNFRFMGKTHMECEDPLSHQLWSTVYDRSTLTLTLMRLPAQRDLSRLPQPFFDRHEKTALTLPFVLPASPTDDALKASAIAASWFGIQAAYRGATFPVVDGFSQGNAVMVVVGDKGHPGLDLPPIMGPTLSVVPNPSDPFSSVLVVAGRTGDEVVAAATYLSVGNRSLAGGSQIVEPAVVAARKPYDAPSWIPTDRPVRFGELVEPAELQSQGYTGTLHIPFRTSPDFYAWSNTGFTGKIDWKAPPGPIIDVGVSRLDVGINGIFLDSFGLTQNLLQPGMLGKVLGDRPQSRPLRVDYPTYDVYGQNDMQFFFDARPLHRGDCIDIPDDLRMSVNPDSTIDLSNGYRFARMPDLSYFVGAGFPFTRMADLSETAVVLAEHPSLLEIGAFLDMMGHFGATTGYPVLGVSVARANNLEPTVGKDVLVMATLKGLGNASSLFSSSAFRVDGSRISLGMPSAINGIRKLGPDGKADSPPGVPAGLTAPFAHESMVLLGTQSPMTKGRSVVAALAYDGAGLESEVAFMSVPDKARHIQGDLAFLSGNQATSYRAGPVYFVGYLPFWMWPTFLLRDNPYGLWVLMLGGSCLLGLAFFWSVRRRSEDRLRTAPKAK